MIERLTSARQTTLAKDDLRRIRKKIGRPHYGLLSHIIILSERLDRIEAALTRARNEALEEAARVADQRAKRANAATDLCPAEFLEEHRAEHHAAMQIATAIRNLKDKGHE